MATSSYVTFGGTDQNEVGKQLSLLRRNFPHLRVEPFLAAPGNWIVELASDAEARELMKWLWSSRVLGIKLPGRGQRVIGRKDASMARRRYQVGSLRLRGKKNKVWVARFREDVIENSQVRRIERSEVLGSLRDYPTQKLARRALESRLVTINDPRYRARPTATFAEFAARWQASVVPQLQPSTQANYRSHLRRYIVPRLGSYTVKDFQPELAQQFISSIEASPKTARNVYVTLQSMWRAARAWGYVAHDALAGVVLPKPRRAERFFFSVEETQKILNAAEEPYRTFYWLAVETGLRAGELCGLRVEDVDLDTQTVTVHQSMWRGLAVPPKSKAGMRRCDLSPQLTDRLRRFLQQWRPNERRLLFATRNGTPWNPDLLVKRKLRPLLRRLGIAVPPGNGLHCFRHTNSSLMDRLGVPLKVRQERLGHSSAKLTLDTYTHSVSEDGRRLAAQLGEILWPNAAKLKGEGLARFEQALVN